MKLLCFILSGFLAVPVHAASQYKGFEKTQNLLIERMIKPGKALYLPMYIPGTYSGINTIYELLGTYSSFGTIRTYKNGQPNSLNVLLWYVLLSSLADDLGGNCIKPTMEFNPQFEKSFQAICAWPATKAKDDSVMESFWIALMGYDAPEEEFVAWKEFFKNSSYQNRNAKETISAMAQAIFLNPFFLLER